MNILRKVIIDRAVESLVIRQKAQETIEEIERGLFKLSLSPERQQIVFSETLENLTKLSLIVNQTGFEAKAAFAALSYLHFMDTE